MSESSSSVLRVCLIATPVGDEADRALDGLFEGVSKHVPLRWVRAWQSAEDSAPDFSVLHQCDVALLCARRMPIAGEALARVQWYCQRGRPVVALRAGGSRTFVRWPDFDPDVLAIEAEGSADVGPLPARSCPEAEDHPALAGVTAVRSHFGMPRGLVLADDAQVLLEGPPQEGSPPMAWTVPRRSARVLATTLGAGDDLLNTNFIRLIANAIRWAAAR